MQKLAEICIHRPIFAAMLILALCVIGGASYVRLGVDRFPSVDLPTVSIRTELPGASTEEIETEISKPMEEAVNTIQGIDELRSISGPGTSVVIVTFNLSRDIEAATQDVRDRIATVLKKLPDDATPPLITKADNDSQPVVTIALSGERTLRELTELADKVVKVRLERSDGVGDVQLVGGLNRAMNIWVEADRLEAYKLPITLVRDAIVRQNTDSAGGNVTRGAREETLRTIGRLKDAQAFNSLEIANIDGAPIRIRDVGWAEDGTKEQRSTARLNGVPTVVLEVRRQSGANTVAVIESVKKNLKTAMGELPAGLEMTVIQDQSRYIYAALHEITLHLVLGSILASLVVLAFMRNWRSTVIAAVAIPSSVIATFGMMRALNFTLNSVTMLALVLMVGVVIDDAIVVLENIFRFIEEKGMKPFDAAKAATADIGLAVMATTLSLVVIFIPVSFMSSISGRFLYQFGITAAVAVMVSLLVSFTLTPMMSARLLRPVRPENGNNGKDDKEVAPRSRSGFYRWIDEGYARVLALAMRNRLRVVLISLLVIISTIPLYKLLKLDYLPGNVDEGEFNVNVTAPQSTSLAAMDEIMLAIGKEIRAVPGVQVVLTTAGGTSVGGVSEGRTYVRLAPHEERVFSLGLLAKNTLAGKPLATFRQIVSQGEIMQEVRKRLKKFRDLRVSVRNLTGFNIGGSSSEIDFVLRGPDLNSLYSYAEGLRTRADALGIMDADTTLKLDKPEMRIQLDRARADDLGVDPGRIGTAIRLLVGGDQEVSRFQDTAINEDYDVQLRLREEDRANPATIGRLFVARDDGSLVRLDNVARIEQIKSASRIDRLDRQREIRLRASVAPGYGLADRLAALKTAVSEMNLSSAYTTAVSGRGRELERTFQRIYLGLWSFNGIHVHDPCLPVRKPHPPLHHPAVTAADNTLCPSVALAHGQHT